MTVNIPDIKLAVVTTLVDALPNTDVYYARPPQYSGGSPYVTTSRVEARLELDGIQPQSRLERYVTDWELVLLMGSGRMHGTPEEADEVVWNLAQSVLETLVKTPRLGLGSGFMRVRPISMREVQGWEESSDAEVVVSIRVSLRVRGQ